MDNPEQINSEVEPSAQLKTDETHQGGEDEGRKGTLARIAEILRGGKKEPTVVETEQSDESVTQDEPETSEVADTSEPEGIEDEPTEDTEDSAEYEEIDTRFVDAARSYGWSDDRIVKYAESHDDSDLVMLTSMMEGKARPVTEDDVTEVPVKEESPYAAVLKELDGNEAVGDLTKQLLKSLVNDLQTTKAQLKTVTAGQEEVVQSRKQTEWLDRLQTADEMFDEAAKEFNELGSTKALKKFPDGTLNPNDPSVKAREDLFKIAVSLFNSGSTWNSAVKDALRWYKGGREDVVEASMLKKIKNNAKRISPKREQRHQVKKFASEIEEKAAVVNEALRKHGVELPE